MLLLKTKSPDNYCRGFEYDSIKYWLCHYNPRTEFVCHHQYLFVTCFIMNANMRQNLVSSKFFIQKTIVPLW